MLKRLLPVLAAFTLLVAAACGDDEGEQADTTEPTETTAASTTSTTEEPEAAPLDEWVEDADEICGDSQDAINEVEAPEDDAPAEDIQAFLELILEEGQNQNDQLEELGLPDEEAEAAEQLVDVLRDREEFLEDAIDLAADEDVETVIEMLSEDPPRQDELDEAVEALGLEVCGQGGGGSEQTEPFTYGDDPELDALWDDCEAGDAAACDELWSSAPADSEYEQFGYSCGGIVPEGESEVCSEILDAGGSGDIPATGDPIIDSMLEACSAGNGVACDQAYALTEPGSEAETFADTCGGTADAGTYCSPELGGAKVIEPEVSTGQSYGDDPELDAMQDACADGDMGQCDLLFLVSPVDSEYERFGGTCGDTFTSEDAPYSCLAGE